MVDNSLGLTVPVEFLAFTESLCRHGCDGATWNALAGYDFSWGDRVMPDPLDPDMIYLTTFGGSFFHGAIRGVPVE